MERPNDAEYFVVRVATPHPGGRVAAGESAAIQSCRSGAVSNRGTCRPAARRCHCHAVSIGNISEQQIVIFGLNRCLNLDAGVCRRCARERFKPKVVILHAVAVVIEPCAECSAGRSSCAGVRAVDLPCCRFTCAVRPKFGLQCGGVGGVVVFDFIAVPCIGGRFIAAVGRANG